MLTLCCLKTSHLKINFESVSLCQSSDHCCQILMNVQCHYQQPHQRDINLVHNAPNENIHEDDIR
jgi:hypothetical protein